MQNTDFKIARSTLIINERELIDDDIKILAKAKNLTKLYCKNCDIKPETLNNLLKNLPKSIKEISFIDNEFSIQEARILAKFIPNKSISLLNLTWNFIAAAGMQALSAVLPSMKKLASLNIAGNCIEDAGFQSLLDVLPDMKSLTSLDVSANSIGIVQAKKLAKLLPKINLTKLEISQNEISFTGIECVIKNLSLTTLKCLIIDNNIINKYDEEKILDIVKADNCCITNIYGLQNSETINALVKSNKKGLTNQSNEAILNLIQYHKFPPPLAHLVKDYVTINNNNSKSQGRATKKIRLF